MLKSLEKFERSENIGKNRNICYNHQLHILVCPQHSIEVPIYDKFCKTQNVLYSCTAADCRGLISF